MVPMFSYLARSRRLATFLVVFFYKIINILHAASDQPIANQDSRYLPSFKNHPCVEGQFLCLVIAHDFVGSTVRALFRRQSISIPTANIILPDVPGNGQKITFLLLGFSQMYKGCWVCLRLWMKSRHLQQTCPKAVDRKRWPHWSV